MPALYFKPKAAASAVDRSLSHRLATDAKRNMTLFQRKLLTLDGIGSLHTDMSLGQVRGSEMFGHLSS